MASTTPLDVPASSLDVATIASPVGVPLGRAVFERRAQYTVSRTLRLKIGSWNVAALDKTEDDLRKWFVEGRGLSNTLAGLSVAPEAEGENDAEGSNASPKHPPETAGENDADDSNATPEAEPDKDGGSPKAQESSPAESHGADGPLNPENPEALPGEENIDIYVLGLQEVSDVSSGIEALRPFNDLTTATKWKRACEDMLPAGYVLVAEQQLIGLLLLVYASPKIAPSVTSVSATSVGTGLMGYMGNKGGTSARIVIGGIAKFVFINSHLAAGAEKANLERRNWDAAQIVARTKFAPIDHGGGVVDELGDEIGDEDFAFWFGDLNYRLDTMPGDEVRRLLQLHTQNEFDVGTKGAGDDAGDDAMDPDTDPASLQTTLASLLPHDQLHEQIKSKRAFHEGWREGEIRFLPTYKYDVGSVGVFDSSEKKRGPSWCDRILYRTRKDYEGFLEKRNRETAGKKRDDEMRARGLEETDETIFDYDPEADGADEYDENDDGEAATVDSVQLEYYTSHQNILSSDHKPLVAIFELRYDAVDYEKKAKVQAQVARELDKDENESKPSLTLVFDQGDSGDEPDSIAFGKVEFDAPVARSAVIANTGSKTATFGLVDTQTQTHPDWLRITFDRGSEKEQTLEPGELLHMVFTVHVRRLEDVRALNSGTASIYEVRVLRVASGRDYFITMRGVWQNSCFGLSLEELIRVPEAGVRSIVLDSESLKAQQVKWSAPRELFRLSAALEEDLERTISEHGMRKVDEAPPWEAFPGWPFLKGSWTSPPDTLDRYELLIRRALDTGAEPLSLPEAASSDLIKIEAMAATFVRLLTSIQGGVIDEELWGKMRTSLAAVESPKVKPTKELIRSTVLDVVASSPARSVAFTLIVFMLGRVVMDMAPLKNHTAGALTPQRHEREASQSSPARSSLDQKSDTDKGRRSLSRLPAAAASAATVIRAPEALIDRVKGLGSSSSSSDSPARTRRAEVEGKIAEIFEPALFTVENEKSGKEKRAGEEKRKSVILAFLGED